MDSQQRDTLQAKASYQLLLHHDIAVQYGLYLLCGIELEKIEDTSHALLTYCLKNGIRKIKQQLEALFKFFLHAWLYQQEKNIRNKGNN